MYNLYIYILLFMPSYADAVYPVTCTPTLTYERRAPGSRRQVPIRHRPFKGRERAFGLRPKSVINAL